jgi:glycerol uptake facilitator-like aquaporin
MKFNLRARLVAEFVGTAFLVAAVVGSGIMGERLAGGNTAIALLANIIATGAALLALILTFEPISDAHLNPAVTLSAAIEHGIPGFEVMAYIFVQCTGGVTGAVPFAVASYITAAYWFTASTSFANPAVTIARSLSETFAGIRPSDVSLVYRGTDRGRLMCDLAVSLAGPKLAITCARSLDTLTRAKKLACQKGLS